MRVLVACEESQRVCMAFRERGHNAFSCDIQEPSCGHPEWHIKSDVIRLINGYCIFTTMDGKNHYINDKWDMIIAFPGSTLYKRACSNGVISNPVTFFPDDFGGDGFFVAKLKKIK